MKAIFICKNLMTSIMNKEIVLGQVHSIFNHACNIETEMGFVTLLNVKKVMSPMSLVVGQPEEVDFKRLDITRNMSFIFNREQIFARESSLCINLEGAQTWSSDAVINSSKIEEEDIFANIKTMGRGIGSFGKLNGINPLLCMLKEEMPELELQELQGYSSNKNMEFMKYRFLNFISSVVKLDFENIDQAAENVIGFGPGLTPAMDDFICGMMVSFIYFGEYYKLDLAHIYKFNQKLISKSLGRTTRFSAEMLKHSAKGDTNQAVKELLQSIINQQNEGNIINALMNTIELGETSGSDMALGIYAGCKIMSNVKYRGEWLNEAIC